MIKETQLLPNVSLSLSSHMQTGWLHLGPTARTKIILVWKAWYYLLGHGSKYSPLPFVLSLNTQCDLPLAQCFPTLLHGGNLTYEKFYRPENREAVAGMRSLPYYQSPDKNSVISRDIWSFSRHFKMFMYLFHEISRKAHGRSAEPQWETLLWRETTPQTQT
jgi:hypothetical protein